MKKYVVLALFLALFLAMSAFAAYCYGEGKRHVIETQQAWILDFDHSENCDFELYMLIDGNWHVYNGYIG